MKKYIIIISAFFLIWKISIANIPVKPITNNKENSKEIKKSQTDIPKNTPTTDSKQENKTKASFVNSDSISDLKNNAPTLKNDSLNFQKANEIQNSEKETINKKQKAPIPNYVFYILSGLVLCLVCFIIILNKMKNKKISFYKNRKDYYKTLFKETDVEKSTLSNSKTNLSGEIFQLKKDKENLQSEIRLLQQKKEINEETKEQEKIQRPQSLYADSIINGQFNRVKEHPNEDTIFELKLNKQIDSKATVVIFPDAYRKVIENPAFLEGCEKQILGNSSVTMLNEGVAQKDSSGKWIITKIPNVKII